MPMHKFHHGGWRPWIVLMLALLALGVGRAGEKAELRFDDRKWKLVNQRDTASVHFVEYLPEGEQADNWRELLSAHLLYGLHKTTTMEKLAQANETKLRNISSGKVTWNLLSQGPTGLMYEWKLEKDNLRPDQHEIARLVIGSEGIHLIRYATRTLPLTEARRQKWIGLLNAVKIVKQPAAGR